MALTWLRNYRLEWLRGDVVAAITLAAYLLPAGLGDASLANLPPEAGLYACLCGGVMFHPTDIMRHPLKKIHHQLRPSISTNNNQTTINR